MPRSAGCDGARPGRRRWPGSTPGCATSRSCASATGCTCSGAPPSGDSLAEACATASARRALAAAARVAARPGGAPTRGRLDVLPTGRNLYRRSARRADPHRLESASAPPRLVAATRRTTATGRALVLDLWGSATMRTGGDDLAQALADRRAAGLGHGSTASPASRSCRWPARTAARRRDAAHLRPVPRHLPEQIALFDVAVAGASPPLDEDAASRQSARAAARRRRPTTLARIFGAAPGRLWRRRRPRAIARRRTGTTRRARRAPISPRPRTPIGAGEAARDAPAFRDRVAGARRVRACAGHGRAGHARLRRLRRARGRLRRRGRGARRRARALSRSTRPIPSAPKVRTLAEEIARVCAAAPPTRAGSRARCATAIAAPPRSPRRVDKLFAFAATDRGRAEPPVRSAVRRHLRRRRVRAFLPHANPRPRARHRRALRRGAAARLLDVAAQFASADLLERCGGAA